MPPIVQIGTILMTQSRLRTPQLLGLEGQPYWGSWSLVKVSDGFALDRKVRDSGWNFFFMAEELKATFFGALGAKKIQSALKRILGKVRQQHFNGVEVTDIVTKRFLGVPYATVSAHPRHVQQSWCLESAEVRRTSQHNAEWAEG
jgi:hypothetical protein